MLPVTFVELLMETSINNQSVICMDVYTHARPSHDTGSGRLPGSNRVIMDLPVYTRAALRPSGLTLGRPRRRSWRQDAHRRHSSRPSCVPCSTGAVVEHHQMVCLAHCRQTMGDHQGRAPGHQALQGLMHNRSFSESRCEVASSRISMGASFRMALAIDSRWRCPPESWTPRSPIMVS